MYKLDYGLITVHKRLLLLRLIFSKIMIIVMTDKHTHIHTAEELFIFMWAKIGQYNHIQVFALGAVVHLRGRRSTRGGTPKRRARRECVEIGSAKILCNSN